MREEKAVVRGEEGQTGMREEGQAAMREEGQIV